MSKKLKQTLKFVVFIGIGLFFIYWFLLKLDSAQKQSIWQSFTSASLLPVAGAVAVCLLSHYIRALRWNLLLAAGGYKPPVAHTFGAVLTAYLANLAFPRLGEVVRCGVLRTSDDVPIDKSLGSVVTERIVDTLAFVVVVALGLLVAYDKLQAWLYSALSEKISLPNLLPLIAVGVVMLVAIVVAYRLLRKRLMRYKLFSKIDALLRNFADGLMTIFRMPRKAVVLFVLYSLAIYFLYIAGAWVLFASFPATALLGFEASYVVYIFGSVGMMVTPGGIGLYPVLVWQALDIYGVPKTVALAFGWLLWSLQQVVVIVTGMGYFIYFSACKKRKLTVADAQQAQPPLNQQQ